MRTLVKLLPVTFGLVFLISWGAKSLQQFKHGNMIGAVLAGLLAAIMLGFAFSSAKRFFNRSPDSPAPKS